jgi:hypothetical protein
MKQFWTLLAVCAGLLALPAAASAQSAVPPPGGDNQTDAIPVRPANSTFLPLTPGVLGFSADTTNYTTEPNEFDACGQSTYGKTIWSVFAVNRTGRIDITAAGYDSVLALLPVTNNGVGSGPCTDRLAGRIESFPRDNLPTVKKGNVYAVQIGGFRDPAGNFAGGQLEADFELLPPERVQGDAILTWRQARGGIRVTSIKVDGPQGSEAKIACVRGSCGKSQTVKNPKAVGVFAKATVGGNKPLSGDKYQPAKVSDTPIRMATRSVFRGRTIRNGARLQVVVSAQNDDQIGQVFFWDVRGNAAGAKSLGCVNPGSSKVRKIGTCTGA